MWIFKQFNDLKLSEQSITLITRDRCNMESNLGIITANTVSWQWWNGWIFFGIINGCCFGTVRQTLLSWFYPLCEQSASKQMHVRSGIKNSNLYKFLHVHNVFHWCGFDNGKIVTAQDGLHLRKHFLFKCDEQQAQKYSASWDVGQLQAETRKSRKGSTGKEADRGDYCTHSLMWATLLYKHFPNTWLHCESWAVTALEHQVHAPFRIPFCWLHMVYTHRYTFLWFRKKSKKVQTAGNHTRLSKVFAFVGVSHQNTHKLKLLLFEVIPHFSVVVGLKQWHHALSTRKKTPNISDITSASCYACVNLSLNLKKGQKGQKLLVMKRREAINIRLWVRHLLVSIIQWKYLSCGL